MQFSLVCVVKSREEHQSLESAVISMIKNTNRCDIPTRVNCILAWTRRCIRRSREGEESSGIVSWGILRINVSHSCHRLHTFYYRLPVPIILNWTDSKDRVWWQLFWRWLTKVEKRKSHFIQSSIQEIDKDRLWIETVPTNFFEETDDTETNIPVPNHSMRFLMSNENYFSLRSH